jgi:hypothetical protein
MDFVLERAREFLGTTCDAQIRLVSRGCRDLLATVHHKPLRVADYLSSVALFVWATEKLCMPEKKDFAHRAARSGCSGCERKTLPVYGLLIYVRLLRIMVICRCSSGCEHRTLPAHGMHRLAHKQQIMAIWRCCSGCETRILLVHGMHELAHMQHIMAI